MESSGESLEIVEQKNGTVRVDLKEDSSLSTVQHGVWEKRLTAGKAYRRLIAFLLATLIEGRGLGERDCKAM